MNEAQDVTALLSRMNELLTVIAKAQLSAVRQSELSDPKKQKLYDATGGTLTTAQLTKKLGMSATTISKTWQHWEQIGLLVKDGKRYRRLFQ